MARLYIGLGLPWLRASAHVQKLRARCTRNLSQGATHNGGPHAPQNTIKHAAALDGVPAIREIGYMQKAYENAVQGGFIGTYDEWRSHLCSGSRKLGGTLTTISLEKALDLDQFFCFRVTPKSPRNRQFRRPLLLNGNYLGTVNINMPAGEEEWLCPYFEPATRTLRFRKRDGDDAEHVLELHNLAQVAAYRPLLYMAHGEGLLQKVPAGKLSSLDLSTVLESGWYSRSTVWFRLGGSPRMEPTYRLSGLGTIPRFQLSIDDAEDRQIIRSFPYVDESQRLRIWDVDEKKPLRLRGRGVVDGALPWEQVLKRSPKLFTWARQLGYWSDVKL